MMINCPKCGFLQDKDQYCAQCGVNMETYRPPQKPKLKKLASNWMVQLAVLFTVIFTLVLWDNFFGDQRKKETSSLPPVANRIQRSQIDSPTPQAEQPPRGEMQNSAFKAPQPQARTQSQEAEDFPAEKRVPFMKKASMKIIALSKSSMDGFFKQGRRVDEGAFVFSRSALKDFLKDNPGSMKSFGTTRGSFTPGQSKELFLGEEDLETGANIGFFSQFNVNQGSTGEAIKFEVRFWYQLKINEEPHSPLIFEVQMAHQDSIVIVDPSVHEMEFTQEDRNLFDASDRLKALNGEDFEDREVALFLELK